MLLLLLLLLFVLIIVVIIIMVVVVVIVIILDNLSSLSSITIVDTKIIHFRNYNFYMCAYVRMVVSLIFALIRAISMC